MKTIFNILCTMVIGAFMHHAMLSDNLDVSGNLVRSVDTTIAGTSIQPKDCDGNNLGAPIVVNSTTLTKTKPFPYNANTPVKFRISRQGLTTFDIDILMSGLTTYDASDGKFTETLSDGRIVPSRFNYTVKVYLNNDLSTVISERDYSLAPAGGVFPLGSVISYMGNSSTVAALEESGWFKCDGRLVSGLSALTGDEQTALSQVIGNNLPDLRGAFLRGLDDGQGWDDGRFSRTGGESHANGASAGVRSYEGDTFKSHNHGGSTGSTSISFSAQSDELVDNNGSAATVNGEDNETLRSHSHSISSEGDAETRPENVAVYWLIRGR